MPEPSPDTQPSESGSEKHLDFEVGKEGRERRITIGDSFEELEQTMELYYPDPEMREIMMQGLLKEAVDRGRLRGMPIRVMTRDDLDLSDEAIVEAFPEMAVGEPAVDLNDKAINKAFFSDEQPGGEGETKHE